MSDRVDVVVAGGGLVGGVMANMLAMQGLDVAVADAAPAPTLREGDAAGARVVALSRGSRHLLELIEAWEQIAPMRRGAYEQMRIWDARGTAWDDDALVFDCASVAAANLGHIVENDAIVAAAFGCAQRRSNITWLSDHQVSAIEPGDNAVRVATAQGAVLSARLVVVADGARSACRDMLGIDVRRGAYQQEAVVTHLDTERAHDRTAYQRFLQDGPLAFLPLADGRSSLVWTTTLAHARELVALPEDQFQDRVSDASDRVLGDVTGCSERLKFPLNWLHAKQYCRPRVALVGDAAHCVHPLAGQGVNLGLLDVATLADVIAQATAEGNDIGDLRVLRRYERWRKSENGTMLAAFSGLNRLFGSEDPWLGDLRRSGLGYVNRSGPIKRDLILRAMGVHGDLPASLRDLEGLP